MRQHRNNKQQISWAERTIRYGKEEKMGIVIFEYTSIFTDIYIYDCSTGNAVRVSFFKWNGYSQKMKFIGLENYISLFSDNVFWRSTFNTFIYGFGSTLLQNIFGLSAALFVNKQFKGRNFVRLRLYMPIMISGVIMGAIQYYVFNYDNGVLNNMLNLIGIENIYWMKTGLGSVLIITLINSWQARGFVC